MYARLVAYAMFAAFMKIGGKDRNVGVYLLLDCNQWGLRAGKLLTKIVNGEFLAVLLQANFRYLRGKSYDVGSRGKIANYGNIAVGSAVSNGAAGDVVDKVFLTFCSEDVDSVVDNLDVGIAVNIDVVNAGEACYADRIGLQGKVLKDIIGH